LVLLLLSFQAELCIAKWVNVTCPRGVLFDVLH
jgi:hypothetical protein